MGDEDDELRKLVKEAAAAAKQAQAAVERLESHEPSRFERILDAIRGLLATFVELVLGRVRSEIQDARRTGEDFVARVMARISRAVANAVDALLFVLVASALLIIAVVTLAVASTVFLNERLGDPAGTAVTGLVVAAVALLLLQRARARILAIGADSRLARDR